MKNPNVQFSISSKFRAMTRVGAFLALVSPGCGAPEPGDVATTEPLPLTITITALSTSSPPTQLSLTTNSNLNSGTTAALWLRYANRSGVYGCYILGIGDGETKTCTPGWLWDCSNCSSFDWVSVQLNAGNTADGLRTTAFGATINGTTYAKKEFSDSGLDCTGCSNHKNCNSCWIDADDHGKCITMTTLMDSDGTSYCNETSS